MSQDLTFKTMILVVALNSLLCVGCMAQIQLVKPAPSGRPGLFQEEGDEWLAPIRIYSDKDVELYVSERLTMGGLAWDALGIRKNGIFYAYVYSYYKTPKDCLAHRIPKGHESEAGWIKACSELFYQRRLVVIDIRKRTATIVWSLLMGENGVPYVYSEARPNTLITFESVRGQPFGIAISRIISMVDARLARMPPD